ncbi:MAG: TolB family protein, partial [Solirubrobacterales bacterium]
MAASRNQSRLPWRLARAKLLMGLGAILLSGLLVVASPAGADQIAYSCGADICLINPDNPAEQTNLTQTTAGIGDERSPSWSPDGSLIAYIGAYGALTNGWDVFTLDPTKSAAEGEFTNLSETTDRSADSEHPAVWSPDGSRVAYMEHYHSNAPPNLGDDVYVSPFDGSAAPLAIASSSQAQNHPSWSPDGKTLAFSQNGITTFAAADGTGSTTPLANGGGVGPTWSPDGKYIAVEALGSYPYEMRIVNADGSGFHDLARPVDLGSTFDWSADSTRIVYVSDEVSSEDQVRV